MGVEDNPYTAKSVHSYVKKMSQHSFAPNKATGITGCIGLMRTLHGKLVLLRGIQAFPIKWHHKGAQTWSSLVENFWVHSCAWHHLMGRTGSLVEHLDPGNSKPSISITLVPLISLFRRSYFSTNMPPSFNCVILWKWWQGWPKF